MRLRLAVALFALHGLVLTTGAAKLPDWAQPFADQAPEIEELSEDFARVLFKETAIEVQPDGRLIVRERRVIQALRTDSNHVGLGLARAGKRMKIVKSRAWHVPPEGKTKKTRAGSTVDLTLDASFLTDAKTRVLPVPDVERGSLVFFEFETEENPWELAYPVIFAEDGPALRLRVAVTLPAGWEVEHTWLSGEGPGPVDENGARVWELTNLAALEDDPLAASPIERAPHLLLSFRPPEGASVAVRSFERWSDVATWYERLSSGRDSVTPEIERSAGEVWGAADDVIAGVRGTATWVRDKVRYVAVDLGNGGYQPRPATDVLGNLYGDCKDKSTLLRAMLAARGVESYPVLINLTRQGTVSDDIPSLSAFNHVILAIPLDDVPPEVETAVVEAGELGPLFFVDPTDDSTSVGHLSAGVTGKKALIVAGERSSLVRLPSAPRGHRVERTFTAEIADDGSTMARVETSLYGEPAGRWRRFHRRSSQDYEDEISREVRDRWTGAEVTGIEVTEETGDGAFVEVVDVRIPRRAASSNDVLFSVFPDALDVLPQVTLSRRETPVEYPHPLSLRYSSRIKGAPSGWGAPDVEERSGEGWSARGEIREDAGEIVGDFEFELRRLTYTPEEFRDLRRVWSGARKAAGLKIDLSGGR